MAKKSGQQTLSQPQETDKAEVPLAPAPEPRPPQLVFYCSGVQSYISPVQ